VIVKVKASSKEKVPPRQPRGPLRQLCHDELVDLMARSTRISSSRRRERPASCWSACRAPARRRPSASWRTTSRRAQAPLLVAADVYRPAAIEQLKVIGQRLESRVLRDQRRPTAICEHAVHYAAEHGRDVILFDTAGAWRSTSP